MLNWILTAVAAYILGATPSGLWICRWLGDLDIRDYGSKNTGATNVYRVMGWKAALFVFLMDSLKGAISVYIGFWLTQDPLGALLGGLMALLGHSLSFWMGFKGGRGVATGVGVLASLMPPVAGLAFLIWLITVLITRYVSLGSILGSIGAIILAWYFSYPVYYQIFVLFIGIFVIFRHRENIQRLLQGTENKVGRISKSKEESK